MKAYEYTKPLTAMERFTVRKVIDDVELNIEFGEIEYHTCDSFRAWTSYSDLKRRWSDFWGQPFDLEWVLSTDYFERQNERLLMLATFLELKGLIP